MNIVESLLSFRPETNILQSHPCWKPLHDLVKKTVECLESNSILMVGPAGCGKTTIIDSVIAETCPSDKVSVVRLSGSIHSESRLALRSFARQLGFCADIIESQSHAEILSTLLTSMRTGGKNREEAQSIILVLDEMDRFCHPKQQHLLYNMLDIAQSLHTPLCVLGVSRRLDVVELLEKRIKSRFSHRQLLVTPMKSVNEVVEAAERMLLSSSSHFIQDDDVKQRVSTTLNTEAVKKSFLSFLNLYGDYTSFQNLLIPIAVQLSTDKSVEDVDFVGLITKRLVADSKSLILRGLSNLELHLLQVIFLLKKRLDDEPFNFALVYKEYANQSNKRGGIKGSERTVVKKAFERLQALEIITPVEAAGNFLPDYLLYRAQLSQEHLSYIQTLLPNQTFDIIH
ncbi:origin recognition complex subunit 4-like isoform X2 [Artemia franciscana]|uniref:origin recognition complex subunit 4-like isoform X2 n=1 Tax=Artemia franciscana TaxID=6661 RepID=UPI0032DB27F1